MESASNPINPNGADEESVNWESEDSQIFLNPRMPEELQSHYKKIFKETVYRHSLPKHLGFLTSGTTVVDPRSYKLVFISKRAFLDSARSVVKNMLVTSNDIWLQCLPRFHVGGMAIEARAYVGKFKTVRLDGPWSPQAFKELAESSKATYTSLVPTQVFDLIQWKVPSPKKLKVLVGGGRLAPGLLTQAKELGWTLWPSYGMTEMASTIAMIDGADILRPLPHVGLDVVNGKLAVRATSMFTAYARVIKGQIELTRPAVVNGGFFVTEDSANKLKNGIMLLGRTQDVVKVTGELVSVPKLRDQWYAMGELTYAHNFHIMAMPDLRMENKIVMVIQKDEKMRDHKVVTGFYPVESVKIQLQKYQSEVMPFERFQNIFVVDSIPKTELGKVQEKQLLETIEKGQFNEIKLD